MNSISSLTLYIDLRKDVVSYFVCVFRGETSIPNGYYASRASYYRLLRALHNRYALPIHTEVLENSVQAWYKF